eukprot:2868937-Pleurochrysis_carterae.AAC.1
MTYIHDGSPAIRSLEWWEQEVSRQQSQTSHQRRSARQLLTINGSALAAHLHGPKLHKMLRSQHARAVAAAASGKRFEWYTPKANFWDWQPAWEWWHGNMASVEADTSGAALQRPAAVVPVRRAPPGAGVKPSSCDGLWRPQLDMGRAPLGPGRKSVPRICEYVRGSLAAPIQGLRDTFLSKLRLTAGTHRHMFLIP